MEHCFTLGFVYIRLEAPIQALVLSWSCFLWQCIMRFHMYRSGVICDGESSRNVLWRPAKYSSAANRTEKLVAAFTVTLALVPVHKEEG